MFFPYGPFRIRQKELPHFSHSLLRTRGFREWESALADFRASGALGCFGAAQAFLPVLLAKP